MINLFKKKKIISKLNLSDQEIIERMYNYFLQEIQNIDANICVKSALRNALLDTGFKKWLILKKE